MNRIFAALLLACTMYVAPAQAAPMTPEQKKEIEEIVRSYLLENPSILREMSAKLEVSEREAEDKARTQALLDNAPSVYKADGDPVVGNPKGDVTIVEFFDYNCSWCKKSVTEVSAIVDQDPNVKVIFKEFPIFGEASAYAAKAALASKNQGKYWELHQALFKHEGQITPDVTDQIAEGLGIDLAKMKTDMESDAVKQALAVNETLARALNINGTPAFVVDDQLIPGYMPQDGLVAAINGVRAAGGCQLC